MKISTFNLEGVVLLEPKRFNDARGSFSETWNRQVLANNGLQRDFVQDNQSHSTLAGTVRGLHCQTPPHAQDKLVRVVAGSIVDVAVDIRKGSPTFAQWIGVELSAENGKQLLVPKGFLHGFVTLEPDTEVAYKCSDFYSPECDGGVLFSDPAIGVDWGISPEAAVLSAKDAIAPTLAEFDSPFIYGENS